MVSPLNNLKKNPPLTFSFLSYSQKTPKIGLFCPFYPVFLHSKGCYVINMSCMSSKNNFLNGNHMGVDVFEI